MPGLARINDIVSCVCCCHSGCIPTTGVIINSSATVNAENANVARVGDMAMCACGHVTVIASGSATVSAEGTNVARLSDPVSGCPVGTIVSSAATVENEQ